MSQKKDSKAGRKTKAKPNVVYIASNRRYFNAVKRVKRHIKRQPADAAATRWLDFLGRTLGMDYKRGAPAVRKAHENIHTRG